MFITVLSATVLSAVICILNVHFIDRIWAFLSFTHVSSAQNNRFDLVKDLVIFRIETSKFESQVVEEKMLKPDASELKESSHSLKWEDSIE